MMHNKMKNIIKVDGLEYIKLSKFKELEKKKEKIVEKKINFQDYTIVDPVHVCEIYPIKRNGEEFEELETELCFFKKVEDVQITGYFNKKWEVEVLKINGSKYSKDYLDDIKKMASVWFSDEPEIFMSYDKDKKEFIKDNPIMFVFGWQMAFILAPRVESEDGE